MQLLLFCENSNFVKIQIYLLNENKAGFIIYLEQIIQLNI